MCDKTDHFVIFEIIYISVYLRHSRWYYWFSLTLPDRFFPFFFVGAGKKDYVTRPFFPPPQRKWEKAVWQRETTTGLISG